MCKFEIGKVEYFMFYIISNDFLGVFVWIYDILFIN